MPKWIIITNNVSFKENKINEICYKHKICKNDNNRYEAERLDMSVWDGFNGMI